MVMHEMRHLMAGGWSRGAEGGNSVPRRGGNRLKYQVEQALKAINYIGQSKKAFRDEKRPTGIHSTKQMEHALSVGMNFVRWLKKQGVKDLFQLKKSHYRNFLAHMEATGISVGYLIHVETNLRLLAKGMDRISESKGFEKRVWVPNKRLVNPDTRERPVDRSYTEDELKVFRERLSEQAKVAFDLQLAFGLRLREVANTRVAHIVEKDGRLVWVAVSDKTALNTAKGVTKAGRGREAPCRPEYEPRIRALIQEKKPEDFVSPLKYNSLKSAYFRAGIKGSHALRHTYARVMLRSELRQKGIEDEGRRMLRRMLENRQAGYRKDHGVTQKERLLYREVVQAVDQVHAYLGHGEGRIDLCEVYMQGA